MAEKDLCNARIKIGLQTHTNCMKNKIVIKRPYSFSRYCTGTLTMKARAGKCH